MPAYIVTLDPVVFAALSSRDGVRGAVVFADNEDDAIDILKANRAGDLDAVWDNADVDEIVAGTDLNGWTLRVYVADPDNVVKADIEVVGTGTDNTIDEIAALAVIALNATAAIAGAAYNSGTQVLTIAETTDNLGKAHVEVSWYPPEGRVAIPGFVVSVSDEAVSDATALTATFPADAYTVPAIAASFAKRN